jgi:branched-chain amino acid transport system substrate-binding protein
MKVSATRVVVLAASLSLGLGLAACSSSSSAGSSGSSTTSSSSGTPYQIGATEDLSGGLAAFGKWFQQTWQAEFDSVNQAGGINGHQVKLTILDDQSNVPSAIANVKQLLSQGNILVTGSVLSDICAGVTPLATAAKVPLDCYATTKASLDPVQEFVFGSSPPELVDAPVAMQWVQTVTKASKPRVAVLNANSAGSQQFASTIISDLQAKGWPLASHQVSVATDANASPGQMAQLAASHPDAIIAEEVGAYTQTAIKALRADGYQGPILNQSADSTGLQALADPNYYAMQTNLLITPTSSGSAAKQYVTLMKAKGITGTANLNSGQIVLEYMRAALLTAALKNCSGTCTGQSLATALANTTISMPGITSEFGYSPTDHDPVSSVYIYGYDASTKSVVLKSGPDAVSGP